MEILVLNRKGLAFFKKSQTQVKEIRGELKNKSFGINN